MPQGEFARRCSNPHCENRTPYYLCKACRWAYDKGRQLKPAITKRGRGESLRWLERESDT